MRVHIASIGTAGPGNRARRLVFDDDRPPRQTSASVVKHLSLEVGQEIAPDAFERELSDAESLMSRERAMRLLSYRERSRSEVLQRLADDGYPPALRNATVDRLVELGLIDDARFAAVFARSRLASGLGPRRIAAELTRSGVDKDLIHVALDEATGDDTELERAVAVLRGRVARDRKERERLIRRLLSRGFGFDTARRAVDAMSNGSPGDPSESEPFIAPE